MLTITDGPYNRLLLTLKKTKYRSYPTIRGKLYRTGSGRLDLGRNVVINSSRRSNHIGEASRTIFKIMRKESLLEIGDDSGMSNTTIVCYTQVRIGKHVKIGGGTRIYDYDFHELDYRLRMDKKTDIGASKPVEIGDHAFIGAYSMILKGVRIGEKSIVGAGSVVTKSIPPGEVWAGNPAKFIKKLDFDD